MAAVREFKKAGLVFDGEDILISSVDQVEFPVKYAIMGSAQESVVKSFAWRTHTGAGVRPSFCGEIEYKHSGVIQPKTINSCDTDDYFWMECPSSGGVTHWRPYLPPEAAKSPHDAADASKPVYTKEMHEAGELPPVGAEYRTNGGRYTSMIHGGGLHHDTVCGKTSDGYIAIHWLDICRPIKTDREKAIENIASDVLDYVNRVEGVDFSHHEDKLSLYLYDLGYRKEQVK